MLYFDGNKTTDISELKLTSLSFFDMGDDGTVKKFEAPLEVLASFKTGQYFLGVVGHTESMYICVNTLDGKDVIVTKLPNYPEKTICSLHVFRNKRWIKVGNKVCPEELEFFEFNEDILNCPVMFKDNEDKTIHDIIGIHDSRGLFVIGQDEETGEYELECFDNLETQYKKINELFKKL